MAATLRRPPTSNPTSKSSEKNSTSGKEKSKTKDAAKSVQKRRVGPQTAPATNSRETWSWVTLTDASTRKIPPIFSRDGNYFFSFVGASVRIHSAISGDVVSTLTPSNGETLTLEARADAVTCAALSPHNPFQLITGSLDGCLRVWDYIEGILIRSWDISQPILHICVHDRFRDEVFVALSRTSPKKADTDKNAVVVKIKIRSQAGPSTIIEKKPIGKTRVPSGFALSPSGQYLVVAAGHKVYVAKTSLLGSGFTKYVSPERLTCLAFHPSDDYFATGDKKGVVRLWCCLNESLGVHAAGLEKKSQTTTMHWHAHAVSSLSFSSNGSYLLSGGEESVLVVWHLESEKKGFVPRVGAPIKTITTRVPQESSEEEYLLELVDATFLFISSASLRVTRGFSRLKTSASSPSPSTSKVSGATLAAHPLTSTIILPSSHPASLQIYRPSTSTLVSELEVAPSNRVSRRDEVPLSKFTIDRTVPSPNGLWMATTDIREDEESVRSEVHLKIWSWGPKGEQWGLNSRIDAPHGSGSVTGVAFNNLSTELATSGSDGKVRLWRYSQPRQNNDAGFWSIRSSINCGRDDPQGVCWSPDNSLVGVSTEQHVTLYDANTSSVLHVLTIPECKRIRSVEFVGPKGRYLIVNGVDVTVVWDLLLGSTLWHMKSPTEIIRVIPLPLSCSFAVITQGPEHGLTNANMFAVSSSSPLSSHTLPFGIDSIAWYPCGGPESSLNFVGITKDQAVVLFGQGIDVQRDKQTASSIPTSAPQKRSLFQDIFGQSTFVDLRPTKDVPARNEPLVASSMNVFDAPSHRMLPIGSIFDAMLPSLIESRSEDVQSSETVDPDFEAMDIDLPEEQVKTPRSQEKVVNEAELKALTELFRLHAVKASPAHSIPRPKDSSKRNLSEKPLVNGVNGVNGVKSSPKPKIAMQAAGNGEGTDGSERAGPQPTSGKKRKKAIDS